jgi:hypothetical protein
MPDIFTQPHEEKKEVVQPAQQQPVQPSVLQQKAPPPQEKAEDKKEDLTREEHTPLVQKDAKQDAEHPAKEMLTNAGNQIPFFAHYVEKPRGIKFVNQEDREEVLLFLRRHFATNIPWLVVSFLLLFLPIIVWILFSASNFTLFSIPTSIIIVLVGFYYVVVFNYALLNFITWYYDMGIVSRKRLIDLDANNILHHHWAETEIKDVVDVSVTQQGFFQSFFNYGNVHIQTEAIKANFEFVAAPKPSTASDIITDLKELITKKEKSHE